MKIIVLVPVKNEEWVLDFFLTITSKFADSIIMMDQQSNDSSLKIASKYDKVVIIENKNEQYDEAFRQITLINKARELFPDEKRVFITIDADEIIGASCVKSDEWALIGQAEPGTVLYFEKPDLYLSPDRCIRYRDNKWPIGIVDDIKIQHTPKTIHSIRIPVQKSSPKLYLNEIIFLHLAYLRPNVQRAKYRFYSVKENIHQTNPWYRRRKRYRSPNHLALNFTLSNTPKPWIDFTEIDLFKIKDTEETWHNYNVASDLIKYGSFKFWLEDIWDIDWNKFTNSTNKQIIRPPLLLNFLLKLLDYSILK